MDTINAESVYRDIRCPVGPKKLLAKMKTQSDPDDVRRMLLPDNLLELSCRDCTKTARREADADGSAPPLRVLHHYNVLGELVETVSEY